MIPYDRPSKRRFRIGSIEKRKFEEKIARVTSKGPFVCPPAQIALQRCAELSCKDKMPPKKRRNSGTITQFNSENQPSKKKVGTHTDGGDGSDNEWAPTQNKPTGFTSPKPAALHQPKSPKIYPIKNVFFRKGYNCIKNKNRWTQPASTTDPKKVEKSILIFAFFFGKNGKNQNRVFRPFWGRRCWLVVSLCFIFFIQPPPLFFFFFETVFIG